MNLKSLPLEEKPRERFVKYGRDNVSNNELIEIILRSGNRNFGIKDISYNILSSIESVGDFRDMEIGFLEKIDGMSRVKAIELLAAIELGRRVYFDDRYEKMVKFINANSIVSFFYNEFKYIKQEIFYVVYLDNQKNYLDKKLLFKGTVNFSLVHPREVFKMAYLLSASYIVCIHNHPSGDATPSDNDIELTKKIRDIGNLHGIALMDHIIIGDNNYYSFFEDNNLL